MTTLLNYVRLCIDWKNHNFAQNKFVISTGAYPDFLPHSIEQDRVCAFL
jgi:hypothetical protein